jgi:hypothetical protein
MPPRACMYRILLLFARTHYLEQRQTNLPVYQPPGIQAQVTELYLSSRTEP